MALQVAEWASRRWRGCLAGSASRNVSYMFPTPLATTVGTRCGMLARARAGLAPARTAPRASDRADGRGSSGGGRFVR